MDEDDEITQYHLTNDDLVMDEKKKALVRGALEAVDLDGRNLLMFAAYHGRRRAFRSLVSLVRQKASSVLHAYSITVIPFPYGSKYLQDSRSPLHLWHTTILESNGFSNHCRHHHLLQTGLCSTLPYRSIQPLA